MAYSQIETRGQFVRLLGLGASGRNLTRRWEKNPTDAGAQRPGVVSLRRMLYLVVWQMAGVLYISDLDEVDWNRRHVVPRDELKPPVSPFLKVVGGGEAIPQRLDWPLAVGTSSIYARRVKAPVAVSPFLKVRRGEGVGGGLWL